VECWTFPGSRVRHSESVLLALSTKADVLPVGWSRYMYLTWFALDKGRQGPTALFLGKPCSVS